MLGWFQALMPREMRFFELFLQTSDARGEEGAYFAMREPTRSSPRPRAIVRRVGLRRRER